MGPILVIQCFNEDSEDPWDTIMGVAGSVEAVNEILEDENDFGINYTLTKNQMKTLRKEGSITFSLNNIIITIEEHEVQTSMGVDMKWLNSLPPLLGPGSHV
jgi:hypothetical protein